MSELTPTPVAPERGAAMTEATDGRKAATQNRIIQAAKELFFACGFAGTSVSQIAARAGVSRAAIFWHFGNKQTLFDETCRSFLVPFRSSLERSRDHLEPRARVLDQVTDYERFVEDNRDTIHAFVSWVFASPEQTESLRRELLALHAAFVKSIERTFVEALGPGPRAHAQAIQLVSLLHGNMLLLLGGATEDRQLLRSLALRRLVDRMLDA